MSQPCENRAVRFESGKIAFARFEVLDCYEGGMGTVLKVYDPQWDSIVALKIAKTDLINSSDAVDALARECEIWGNIRIHPNIVQCYYFKNFDDTYGIVAEFLEGGSLQESIANDHFSGVDGQKLAHVLKIALDTARGIQFAHENGVVHQDIKPSNILQRSDGTAAITDFGISRATKNFVPEGLSLLDESAANLFTCGGMTPAYCSPEQKSQHPITIATDIWSWALVVIEMLMGERTWTTGIAGAHVLEGIELGGKHSEQIPLELKQLLENCLQLDPDHRPPSFEPIIETLENIWRSAHITDPMPAHISHVDTRASSLSNRGVSMIELGNTRKGLELLREAVNVESNHAVANYNLGLARWRQAEITDLELLENLDRIEKSNSSKKAIREYKACVQIERLGYSAALRELGQEEHSSNLARTLYQQLKSLVRIAPISFESSELVSRRRDYSDDLAQSVIDYQNLRVYSITFEGRLYRRSIPDDTLDWEIQLERDDGYDYRKVIDVCPSANIGALLTENRKVSFFDLETGSISTEIDGPPRDRGSADDPVIRFNREGNLLAIAFDKALYSIDLSGPLEWRLLAESGIVQLRVQGDNLWASGPTQLMRFSNFTTLDKSITCEEQGNPFSWGFDIGRDGKLLWARGGNILEIDSESMEVERTIQIGHSISSIVYLQCSNLILINGRKIFNELRSLEDGGRCVRSLDFEMRSEDKAPFATNEGDDWLLLEEGAFQRFKAPFQLSKVEATEKVQELQKNVDSSLVEIAEAVNEHEITKALKAISSFREIEGYQDDIKVLAHLYSISKYCRRQDPTGIVKVREIDLPYPPLSSTFNHSTSRLLTHLGKWNSGNLRVIDLGSSTEFHLRAPQDLDFGKIEHATISHRGDSVVSLSLGRILRLWSVNGQRVLRSSELRNIGSGEMINDLITNNISTLIAMSTWPFKGDSSKIRILDMNTFEVAAVIDAKAMKAINQKRSARDPFFFGCCISRDSHYVFAAVSDGTIRVFDLDTLKNVETYSFWKIAGIAELPSQPQVTGIELSRDGCYLTARANGGMVIIDVRNFQRVYSSETKEEKCVIVQNEYLLSQRYDRFRILSLAGFEEIFSCDVNKGIVESGGNFVLQTGGDSSCFQIDWGYTFSKWREPDYNVEAVIKCICDSRTLSAGFAERRPKSGLFAGFGSKMKKGKNMRLEVPRSYVESDADLASAFLSIAGIGNIRGSVVQKMFEARYSSIQ
jgi:serine/threonine protein kinase